MRSEHVVALDEESLLALIVRHSIPVIEYGVAAEASRGAVSFDLGAIEAELIETFIVGRFPMEIDVRSFEFVGGQNSDALLTLIAQNVPQHTLSFDVWQSFDNQFETAFQRKQARQVFEESVAFLAKMGRAGNSESLAETPMAHFMRDTLQMTRADYGCFAMEDAKKLKLKHLASLWTFLTQRLARDDSARSKAPQHTLHKYRVALPSTLSAALTAFIKAVPLGRLSQIVLKWKNILETYGHVEYNVHTATVNQFLFLDEDEMGGDGEEKQLPEVSLQHFGTAFEFVAAKFYQMSK